MKILGLLIIGLVLTPVSCTTMKLDKFPQPAETSFVKSRSANDVSVYFKPLSNEKDYKKYFGANLMDKGILSIYMSIKNDSPESSYIIPAESIKLSIKDYNGRTFYPTKIEEQNPLDIPFHDLVVASAVTNLAVQQYSDATIIQENFKSVRFRTQTIDAGKAASGFAYFNLKDIRRAEDYKLCFKIIDPIADKSIVSCEKIDLEKVDP